MTLRLFIHSFVFSYFLLFSDENRCKTAKFLPFWSQIAFKIKAINILQFLHYGAIKGTFQDCCDWHEKSETSQRNADTFLSLRIATLAEAASFKCQLNQFKRNVFLFGTSWKMHWSKHKIDRKRKWVSGNNTEKW